MRPSPFSIIVYSVKNKTCFTHSILGNSVKKCRTVYSCILCLCASLPALRALLTQGNPAGVLCRDAFLYGTSHLFRTTKPGNPRHFDGSKGGRTRVSNILLTKTVFGRGVQPLFQALFGVKTLCGTLFGPPLQKPGYGTRYQGGADRGSRECRVLRRRDTFRARQEYATFFTILK